MKIKLAAFAAGMLFAIGLGISGMTQPDKVIGFLDLFGKWDPALMFVMGGAVLVYGIGFRLLRRLARPILAAGFQIPTRKDIDARLLTGASLFGVGWGLSGFCPGPALVSLASLSADVFIFVGAMLVGMWCFKWFNSSNGVT